MEFVLDLRLSVLVHRLLCRKYITGVIRIVGMMPFGSFVADKMCLAPQVHFFIFFVASGSEACFVLRFSDG